jgi:hypothetical protein
MIKGENPIQTPKDMIMEGHDNDQEINEDEFLQHSNNPRALKITNKIIRKDPNTIFL